jgi:ribosomal protein L16 Arg81 hydroxylase
MEQRAKTTSRQIFDKGKIETDLNLESGDLIYVPDRMIRF